LLSTSLAQPKLTNLSVLNLWHHWLEALWAQRLGQQLHQLDIEMPLWRSMKKSLKE
jgi:hypothetical protein